MATTLLARTAVCRADEPANGPAPAPEPTAPVRVHIGGSFQSPQPSRPVAVESDSEGTRLLSLDTSSYGGADVEGPRQQVCVAPCTALLSPSGTYMIRGYAITDSAHFGIGQSTTALQVHTGSSAVSTGGALAMTLGVLSTIAGAVVLPIGLAKDPGDSQRPAFVTTGWTTVLGGAALIGLGVVLGLAGNTHIYDGGGARLARAQGPRLTPSGLIF
jgi:hypothetical protein